MSRPHIPTELRRQVIEDAGSICGYCLSDEILMGIALTFEHIVPIAMDGQTSRDNLWRSCRPCNENKSSRTQANDPETGQDVSLFNPRTQKWREHFAWNEEYTQIVGSTATGKALQLNRSLLVKARRRWRLMGWLPASED